MQKNINNPYHNLKNYQNTKKMLSQLKNIPRQSILTLIGTILIKLATSTASCWGSINLYVLSYFYHHHFKVTPNTNSILILVSIIPISFLMLFATKFCDRFGYQRVIRACSFIYLLAPFVLWISFNFYTLIIFGMFLPFVSFAISTIPVINCLWTRFKDMKNKATAIAVISYALGGILWNYLFTLAVNPKNQPTQILQKQNNLSFFSKEVADRVVLCFKIGYFICGSMFVIGAQMISKNQDYQESTSSQEMFQMGTLPLQNSINKNQNNNKKLSQKKAMPLTKALLDPRFVAIFLISFFSGLYQIFLMMNLKIIYMPIIQDDRFLVYCAMLSSAVSIIGSFLWGYYADKRNFYQILLIFAVLDCGIKIFGKFATTKPTLMILFVFIGFVDKSMMTIIGPGLVKIFGIQTGTQLLPYKGLSIFIGFLIAPLGYIALNSILTPVNYLFSMVIYSIISIILALKLYRTEIE